MKNIFNLIALVFGIGQSAAQPQVFQYHQKNIQNCILKGKRMNPKTTIMYINLDRLSKKEFVYHMKSKNIICL